MRSAHQKKEGLLRILGALSVVVMIRKTIQDNSISGVKCGVCAVSELISHMSACAHSLSVGQTFADLLIQHPVRYLYLSKAPTKSEA
jgi:hypothetical protein